MSDDRMMIVMLAILASFVAPGSWAVLAVFIVLGMFREIMVIRAACRRRARLAIAGDEDQS